MLFRSRGGRLAFCEINHRSRHDPLTRVQLEAVTGNLSQRAAANQRNKQAVHAFQSKVLQTINQPRSAKVSDVLGAIARCARYFGETGTSPTGRQCLIVVSDLEHDAKPLSAKTPLSDAVEVLLVGVGDPALARRFFKEFQIFESIEAAVNHLENPSTAIRQTNRDK